MRIKLKSNVAIDDFDDGKILVDLDTFEGIFLALDAFKIIEDAQEEFITVSELSSENYNEEAVLEFVNELIEIGILISI